MNLKPILILFSLLTVATALSAAEMDPSQMDHSKMDHSQMNQSSVKKYSGKQDTKSPDKLSILKTVPASGVAREADYDGRYGMESTTIRNKLATRCAQASRGLIMMDNAGWKRCGGKPKGVAKGMPAKTGKATEMDHSQHMNH